MSQTTGDYRASPALRSLTIDDEQAICDLIDRTARSCGFESYSTTVPREFYDLYDHLQPQVVTLDLHMVDADGIEILRWISQNSWIASVIVISGADRRILAAARSFAVQSGLNVIGALEKPFGIAQLRALFLSFSEELRVFGDDEIEDAIADDAFVLHYQPKVSLLDSALVGVEALVRWKTSDGKLLYPARFLDAIEHGRFIDAFTAWVATRAARDAATWAENGVAVSVAINMSANNLHDIAWPERLSAICKVANLPEAMMEVEVTESSMVGEARTAIDVLTRLRLKGFSLALDDFGTGHSSLTRLYELPIANVKIDKSFVLNCTVDEDSRAIVEAVIGLSHALKLKVTAEGAEDEATCQLLKTLGCDEVQGYHIARPMAADALLAWAEARRCPTAA